MMAATVELVLQQVAQQVVQQVVQQAVEQLLVKIVSLIGLHTDQNVVIQHGMRLELTVQLLSQHMVGIALDAVVQVMGQHNVVMEIVQVMKTTIIVLKIAYLQVSVQMDK